MPRNWFNRPLPLPKVKRTAYDLHEDRLQTMRLARLCPIGVQECLPNDVHMFSHDAFLRLAPLKYPILQKLNLNISSFFVPDRLVLGEDKAAELFSSLEPSEKLIPKLRLYNTDGDGDGFDAISWFFSPNGLADYFGIQADISGHGVDPGGYVTIDNPVPFVQYVLILINYFLDEQLDSDLIETAQAFVDSYIAAPLGGYISIGLQDEDEDLKAILEPFHVRKYRDYYTAGLPSPQRGDDVYIMNPASSTPVDASAANSSIVYVSKPGNAGLGIPKDGLFYYNSDASSAFPLGFDTTVRDLLTKMAYQRYKNQLNQFGTRYNEFLAGNFSVINQDVRLQRAECIGRSKGVFQISEVIQQSASQSDSPLGSYAGRGVSGKRTRNFRYHVNEHGFLFHLVSVVPDQGYMSGAPKWLFKTNGLDFALPQFNNVGEQTILKGELYYNPAGDSDRDEFAYIPRYSEYRSGRNYASAGMRQSPFTAWHLYEQYDNSVALNSEFIEANDSDRIFNLVDPTSVQNVVGVFHSYHVAFRPIAYNPK